MKDLGTDAALAVETDMKFLPLVMSFAESSSRVSGLDDRNALKLTLASEEIFSYLCRMTGEPKPLSLTMMNGGYYASLRFTFEGIDFDPRAFNLTADMSLDEEGLEEMGLLIASRSVDSLSIFHNPMEGTGFILVKEKHYPETDLPLVEEVPDHEGLSIKKPDSEDIRALARSIVSRYGINSFPQDFRYPGKLVDMVESAEYDALVARDAKDRIAGGIIWRYSGTKMVESYGPYLFVEKGRKGLAEELVNGLIGGVAKSEAVCLFCKYISDDLPPGYFERLGEIDCALSNTGRASWQFFFRQLKEDPGCRVYTHPGMEGFLRDRYRQHFLARELVPVSYEGERRNPHSVFAVSFQRSQDFVTIRPLWDGADAAENLGRHVDILKGEGVTDIFFEIDLGHGWQSRLYPVIKSNGFEPCLVVPYGGKADIVIFCWRG